MIEQILLMLVVFILGALWGQHSVWAGLRRKGHVRICDWCYTAVKVKKDQ